MEAPERAAGSGVGARRDQTPDVEVHLELAGQRLCRLPLAVVPADAAIAWLMKASAPLALCAGWLAAASALQILVARNVAHASARASTDRQRALEQCAFACLAFGMLHALAVAVVLGGDDAECSRWMTMLAAVLSALGVVAAAGWPRAFFLWSSPIVVATCAGWLLAGGVAGFALASMLLLLFGALAACVRDDARAVVGYARAAQRERMRGDALLDERDAAKAERDRAEAASHAKTRFFAAASHDLRQSLHALAISATTVSVLAERHGNEMLERVGAGIGRALAESRGILDGLLDLSRLDAGAVEVRLESVDAAALLERVAEFFEPLARERGLELQCRISGPRERLFVRSDADQLLRILHNLVANALKFTLAGTVTLDAAPARAAASVVLRIADTGIGIAKADQERVFDEFYQVDRTAREHGRGIGLGLAIVRRTTQLLGIELRLHSKVGVGSTFELIVPAARSGDRRSPGVRPAARSVAPDAPAFDVLLIDDEIEVLDSLAMLLESAGWRVSCAHSGQHALELLATGYAPQVVALDLRLRGGESGLDVLHRLRAAGCNAAAVFVSGETEPQRLQAARATGLPILYKPVDGYELLEALRRAVSDSSGGARHGTGRPDSE